MFSRFGLRLRMAASYVLVSAAAVVVVESVVLAVAVPRIHAADREARQAQQRADDAEAVAQRVKLQGLVDRTRIAVGAAVNEAAARKPGSSDRVLLAVAAVGNLDDTGSGRQTDGAGQPAGGQLQAVATTDGTVIASWPDDLTQPALPPEAVDTSPHDGRTQLGSKPATWATAPIVQSDSAGHRRVIGIVYAVMQLPTIEPKPSDARAHGVFRKLSDAGAGELLIIGAVVLVLLVPIGALFGLLSTGRLIRRIRRLGEGTAEMADGDLGARVEVSGGDEVGRLEEAFNTMAERLESAVETQRRAAGSAAQRAERTRIARELHDAISQDLFSASLIAAGLRKALPPDTELHFQAGSMETLLMRTMREMRAMLLELRPIALEDAGLASALDELCRAYGARLGITISTRIDDPLALDPAAEHAVFRMVQETLGNAARHGRPSAIELRVAGADGQVAVTVHDDGHGFDPATTNGRHGMGLQLMRERVRELGGTMEILSAPDRGTTIRVLLPTADARQPQGG